MKRHLERAMDSNDKDFAGTPARLDKTLNWLRVSRDVWKIKTKVNKKKLKIATLGIKRARESRDETERELNNKQKQLDQKDSEIALLKRELEKSTQEVNRLKKKR